MTLGGCSNLVASTLLEDPEGTTRFSLPLQSEFRSGRVVARNDEGSMLVKGPSFVVDRAAEHGMSGGPVILGARGEEALVAGIVSHGSSFSEETTCAELWPMYGFQMPWLQRADGSQVSLLELADLNWISDASDPVRHISVVPADEERKRVEWNR
jgi:hypothetical protein